MQPIDDDHQQQQLLDIRPRLCTLHKWSHYHGYGIHLSCNKHSLGLRIDDVEPNSPAESGGLRRGDIVLAVNGNFVEDDDFFAILMCIEYALEQDQIRFLVLDAQSASLVQRYRINIDENDDNCIRTETSPITASPNRQAKKTTSTNSTVLPTSPAVDFRTNLQSELRMCSVLLGPTADTIGISLEPDVDFGHIITSVERDSPADRAGIEPDHHIISVNHTSLIHLPFEDVLYFLKWNRQETKLNFLVAKKSHLFQALQNHLSSQANAETNSPLNILRQTAAASEHALRQAHSRQQQSESSSPLTDEQSDLLSLQIYSNQYSAKDKKQRGKVLDGIGPATAVRYSWSVKSQKPIDSSSEHSDPYAQKSVVNELQKRSNSMKVSFNLLQVGMTNPSPKPPPRRILTREGSYESLDDSKRSMQSPSFIQRLRHSPRASSSASTTLKRNARVHTPPPSLGYKQTISDILRATAVRPSPVWRSAELDTNRYSHSNPHFSTISSSELSEHGYELHKIKLIRPTDAIPLGVKLSKQSDSSQCVVTEVDAQSRADLAGLQIDDVLVQIEDQDVRSAEFSDVSHTIHQLFNKAGSVNILVGRKKSLAPSSLTDDQRMSTTTAYDQTNESNALLSVGLSNKMEDNKNVNQPSQQEDAMFPSLDASKEQIRHIILEEASTLDFYSFAPEKNSPFKIHAINNVRPLSSADRAGLRNGDRILTVNNIDVTNTNHKTVRHRLLKKSPVYLTVINDPKYLPLIETVKSNQNRIRISTQTSLTENIEEPLADSLISADLINVLFIDDQGPVYKKHCVLKRDPAHDSLGFALRSIDHLHVIDDVVVGMPAHRRGLRNDDVVLYVNKQNVEQMPRDDVKILIRTLALSNEAFHLVLLKRDDVRRLKHYEEKGFVDWKSILSDIHDDHREPAEIQRVYATVRPTPTPALSQSAGSHVCVLKPSAGHPAGFSISGDDKQPFIISKVDRDSPAERAGLHRNDVLLSINGTSLLQRTYDNAIQIIKEALQQANVQVVVDSSSRLAHGASRSSSSESSEDSGAESTTQSSGTEQESHRNINTLEAYQTQRSRELAYTLRLCHLNATNADGTSASSFGFETNHESKYEYPVISRVEPRSPGERSGLQARDLLLKVNGRKTKGRDLERVKRTIAKAKYDGRLELLVVDEEVYRHCITTHRKFKEPYIKVKHIFPKNRSFGHAQSLDSVAARASVTSQEIVDQLKSGGQFKVHRLSISKDGLVAEDEHVPALRSDKTTNPTTLLKQKRSTLTKRWSQHRSTDESMVDSVLNTINHFFQPSDSQKAVKRS